MPSFYRLAADVIVVVHLAFVAFVVLGQLAILLGVWRGWPWVRGLKFRVLHLLAIAVVVVQSVLGATCPLTIWEKDLRRLGGQEPYPGDFLARWAHDLLFFDAEPWVFTVIYTLFGLLVLLTFVFAPPVWRAGLSGTGDPSSTTDD